MVSEPQREKKGVRQGRGLRLPRLGRMSQLLLLVGISAIVIIALWMVYQQQVPKRAELEQTLVTLQRTLAGIPKQETSKDALTAQLKGIEAEAEATKALFCTTAQSPEILDKLLKMAELYDIDVIKTQQSASEQTVAVGKNKVKFQVFSFTLDLSGQVATFQNFLLALGSKLPTSQISKVSITVAAEEGEQDKAVVTIDVFCMGVNKE